MAKARISRPSGTTIVIEGSTEEVAELVEKLEGRTGVPVLRVHSEAVRRPQQAKQSLSDLIITLVDSGFFKEPKDLSTIKTRLDEMGYHYPITTLSPALLRRVRGRHLRRLKQGNRWFYTG